MSGRGKGSDGLEDPRKQDRKNHSSLKAKHERTVKRLWTIQFVIWACFIFLVLLTIFFAFQLIYFPYKDPIYNSPVFITIVTIIGTTLTTAVGVVIGSSID